MSGCPAYDAPQCQFRINVRLARSLREEEQFKTYLLLLIRGLVIETDVGSRSPSTPKYGAGQRECRLRPNDPVIGPVSLLLGRLDRLPVGVDLRGTAYVHVGKNMRVSAYEFVTQRVGDIIDLPRVGGVFGGNACVEEDLQEHVTEFFTQMVAVTRFDRVDGLVGLFEQIFRQRLVRLLGIPRAAASAAQPIHDLHCTCETRVIGPLRGLALIRHRSVNQMPALPWTSWPAS